MAIKRNEARDLIDDFLYFAYRSNNATLGMQYTDVDDGETVHRPLEYAEQEQLIQRFLDAEVNVG